MLISLLHSPVEGYLCYFKFYVPTLWGVGISGYLQGEAETVGWGAPGIRALFATKVPQAMQRGGRYRAIQHRGDDIPTSI